MLDRKREVQQPASLSATASRREIEREEEEDRVVTEEEEAAKGQRKRVGRALLLDVAPTPTGRNGMGKGREGKSDARPSMAP